jgi:ABC-2 type transport system ATP-binding protein
MIQAEGLTKFYGDLEALSNVSFEVAAGGILGLVGPNGAGKTTCLRVLSGVLTASRGLVRIGGHVLSEQPVEAKRLLALVPDEPQLFPYLTVAEHMQFLARVHQLGDVRARIDRLLREFDLAEWAHSMPGALSRGMLRKAAVCCALLHNPRAIFIDEPLTGLDPVAVRRIKDAVRQRAADGAAVIISSHILGLVEELCDRILILKSGRAVAYGTRGEIARRAGRLRADSSLEDIFLAVTNTGQAGTNPRKPT